MAQRALALDAHVVYMGETDECRIKGCKDEAGEPRIFLGGMFPDGAAICPMHFRLLADRFRVDGAGTSGAPEAKAS